MSAAEPLSAMRRGACPALSAPMQTGDGLLVRLNLAEGGMAPEELAALCELAARHGNGIVEVTARGSFQMRGLTRASAPLLEVDVAALGLDLREGVPVETSPLAGLDPAETADPLPLVRAIRAAIETAGLPGRLGPKVSVVVDGRGSIDLSDILADLRLTALRHDDTVFWQLAIGNARTAGPLALLDASGAVAATVATLEAIAARGMSARARDLPPSVLPDISPKREMSGRTEGGNLGRQPSTSVPLADSRLALFAALPFGSMEAAGLAAFVRAATRLGVADIRLAPARSLILLCPDEAAAAAVANEARGAGLILDPTDPLRSVAACPGAPACTSGRIATRELARRLAARGSLAGSVHVSGCAKGCAHPAPARLVLVGADAGLALVRDGRAGDKPETIFPDAEAALAALASLPEPAE